MKITTKIIIIFLTLTLVPIIASFFISTTFTKNTLEDAFGDNLNSLAVEKAGAIDVILGERIDEAKLLAGSSEVVSAVLNANASYDGKTKENIMADIKAIDEDWIEKKASSITAQNIIDNKLSSFLSSYQEKDNKKYGEIFVTDKEGASIGITKVLSDYYQADEGWWQEGFADGFGDVFLDDRGFDETVQSLVIGVVVPVLNDGNAVGVLKINYKVDEILNIIASRGNIDAPIATFLARSQGEILSFSGANPRERMTEYEMEIAMTKNKVWFEDSHNDEATVMVFAPVSEDIFVRVPTIGERRGISGEKWDETKWLLAMEISRGDIFAPINSMQKTLLFAGLLIMLIALGAAFYAARVVTVPLKSLTKISDDISKGKVDSKMDQELISSKDEFGELARAFDRIMVSLKLAMGRTAPKAVAEQKRLKTKLENKQRTAQKIKNTLEEINKIVPDEDYKAK